MSVVNCLRKIAEYYGDETVTQVSQRCNIPFNTVKGLWQDKNAYPSKNTLEKLVRAYRVHVWDLITWEEDEN